MIRASKLLILSELIIIIFVLSVESNFKQYKDISWITWLAGLLPGIIELL